MYTTQLSFLASHNSHTYTYEYIRILWCWLRTTAGNIESWASRQIVLWKFTGLFFLVKLLKFIYPLIRELPIKVIFKKKPSLALHTKKKRRRKLQGTQNAKRPFDAYIGIQATRIYCEIMTVIMLQKMGRLFVLSNVTIYIHPCGIYCLCC